MAQSDTAPAWFSTPPSELFDERDQPGFHYEWVADEGSRVATAEEHDQRKCRRPHCDGDPVMALWRSRYSRSGYSGNWWLYCADHLYGRRIQNGVVESRRLVADESPA